jgi:uncharacterized membrane protein YeiB
MFVTTQQGQQQRRLQGVDVARALAIIGMLAVHLGPKDETDLAGRLYALPHGRASILFVLVAGVGIALLSVRPERRSDARLRLFAFALFLLPLGLALQALNHPVAVILHHYAAFYVLGIAALGLSPGVLAGLAGTLTLVGPALYLAGRIAVPGWFDHETVVLGDTPGTILMGLLTGGAYPLLVWGAPLLWGLWIGRQDLRSDGVRRRLMVWGAVVAALSIVLSELLLASVGEPAARFEWRYLFTDSSHSQMPLWLSGATGAAAFVLGAALHFADRFPHALAPLATLGQVALSLYVLHILMLVVAGGYLQQNEVLPAFVVVCAFTAVAAILAAAWRTRFARGPVETLMHLAWDAMEATLGRGHAAPSRRRSPTAEEEPRPVPLPSRTR